MINRFCKFAAVTCCIITGHSLASVRLNKTIEKCRKTRISSNEVLHVNETKQGNKAGRLKFRIYLSHTGGLPALLPPAAEEICCYCKHIMLQHWN